LYKRIIDSVKKIIHQSLSSNAKISKHPEYFPGVWANYFYFNYDQKVVRRCEGGVENTAIEHPEEPLSIGTLSKIRQ
jgi:hypothetical protein